MRRSTIEQRFLVTNICFESAFLLFSLVYYYQIYQRCKPFKTPYKMSNASTFPILTSNQILSYDCTASSSDSTILILKSASLIVKLIVKEFLWQCRSRKIPPSRKSENTALLESELLRNTTTKPKLLRSYPRQLYQLLLFIDISLFILLLFFSWLPTFNKFYPSTNGCPNFFATGWHFLTLDNTIDTHCDTEAYKWQKFSWAEEFLWLVVVTLSVYQISKITYDALQLKYADGQLQTKFERLIQIGKKLERKLALPCTAILYTESIAISIILSLSCYKFPGGAGSLIKNFVTIALTKVDSEGRVKKEFTDFAISATQVEQQNFYGFIAALIIILVSSFILSTIIYTTRSENEIKALTANSGAYLRQLLESIALIAPFLATSLFTISSVIVNQHDSCYLDNTWNSLLNLFNAKSESILPGANQSCNLYSVSAVQGSPVLQTAILAEIMLAFPLALFSLFTIADVFLKNCSCWEEIGLKKLSFFYQKNNNQTVSDTATSQQLVS